MLNRYGVTVMTTGGTGGAVSIRVGTGVWVGVAGGTGVGVGGEVGVGVNMVCKGEGDSAC